MTPSVLLPLALAWVPLPVATASAVGPDSLPAYVADPIHVRADAPDRLAPSPLAITRLTREDLDRRPGATLGQLLAGVAGVRIAGTGLDETAAQVSLRGSTNEQVVLLVDGRRFGTAQGGGANVAAIPLDSIESVDVARGGASALWGPDAIGGAILVHTRPPRPGGRVRVAGGSFGARSAAGEWGVRAGSRWALRAAARTARTDGDYAWTDDETGERRTIVNGDLARSSGEIRAEGDAAGWRVRADASGLASERGVPGSEEFPSPAARLAEDRVTGGLLLERARGTWRPSIDLSAARQTHRYRDAAAPFGPLDDSHRNTRARAELAVGRTMPRGSFLAAGAVATDRLDSTTDGAPRRDRADVRVQASWDVTSAPTLRALGACRWDGGPGEAPFVSARGGLGATWRDLLLSVSAGTSFRPPTFDELFWPPRASAAGNPDLRPERGRDADVSVAWSAGGAAVHASTGFFVRDVTDLIQWIPGADGVWRPHNLASARLAGVETEGRMRAGIAGHDVRLGGQVTWLATEDRSGEPNADGRDLPYRARWTSEASAALAGVAGGEAEVVLHAISAVPITRANTKDLPGYATWDFRWRRALRGGLALDAAMENVGDVTGRDTRDYPRPGRSLRVGLAWEGERR